MNFHPTHPSLTINEIRRRAAALSADQPVLVAHGDDGEWSGLDDCRATIKVRQQRQSG